MREEEFYEAYNLMQEIYDKKMANFNCPIPSEWTYCLWWTVTKVNPVTRKQEEDEKLNTEVEFWLEYGFPEQHGDTWIKTHDYELDCGALTFEDAVIELARLTKRKYPELVSNLADKEYETITRG